MSIFNDLLPKIVCIPKNAVKNIRDELEGFEAAFHKMEEDYFRIKNQERVPKISLMTTLQSIDEDDSETRKSPEKQTKTKAANKTSLETNRRGSKKRSKDEVDGIASPDIDKRRKRNASVKAQSIITAQVNVNLTQKLRRESPADTRVNRDGSRNNPLPPIKIKQEKVSLPAEPEPMEACSVPAVAEPAPSEQLASSIELSGSVKREPRSTGVMPPPAIIPPKRRAASRQLSTHAPPVEEENTRRSARQRKPKDMDFPPPAAPARSTRASRASSRAKPAEDAATDTTINKTQSHLETMPPPEARPKRTRAKKKLSESSNPDAEKENAPVNIIASPNEKPRPKRTRRGQKAAEKESEKPATPVKQKDIASPKEDRISKPQSKTQSPVPQKPKGNKTHSEEKLNTELKAQNSVEEKQNSKLQKQSSAEETQTKKGSSKDADLEVMIKKLQKENSDLEKQTKSVQRSDSDENKNRKLKKPISDPEIQTKNVQKQDSTVEKHNTKLQKQNSDLEKQNNRLQKQNSDLEKHNKRLQKQDSDDKLKKTKQIAHEVCVSLTPEAKDTKLNETVTLHGCMNSTMVLPNGVYNHAPVTPKNLNTGEEERCNRATVVLAAEGDATIVLDTEGPCNVTDDNSLLTEDGSLDKCERATTPPRHVPKAQAQPTSAVKQKVQQFEQLAARSTRTKTRQLEAEAAQAQTQEHTPPGMPNKGITMDTLERMNNMIFNGKPPAISKSALKPSAIPAPKPRPASASASKAATLSRHQDEMKEDARKKKEAMLEAKREQQRSWSATKSSSLSRQYAESLALKEDARKKKEALIEERRERQRKKREEKIAAAAAAREEVERQRQIAIEAAARERQEKQAHADQGKLERLKEIERKRQEQARKAADTEERRRADEHARQLRLAEEQRKAEAARKKQIEEMEAMKKEAMDAKEMERRQKEYIEKQKMKHMDKAHPSTPIRQIEPTYMCDGFQHLNSDEDYSPPKKPPQPSWCSTKVRNYHLSTQSELETAILVRLFPSKIYSPDLREIFPGISRNRLVRTSSAVWRTPPKVDDLLISRMEQIAGGGV